ncbi:leukocyte immunoglobulin-like receptor subfamily A member 6, partial [Huso huso]
ERPQAVLTQEPAWTQIYESERVTLRCQVQGGYTDWRFTWYKAGRNAPVTQDYYSSIDGDRYTISSATGDHSGEYTCKGERRGNPSYSKTSDALTLRVSERPQAVLTQEPAWTQIYESESVTLRCQVQGGYTDWKFTWYKAGRNAPVTQDYYSSIYGDRYTIRYATRDHSGEYTCKGERRGNPSYSKTSHALTLRVSGTYSTPSSARLWTPIPTIERPQAVLTREPAWTQIYESERVTLRCQVQGGYTDWKFTWYKAGRNAPVTQDYYSSIDGDRYTIRYATRDHSGEYTCKGERTGNPSYSKTSDALTLRVSARVSTSTLTVTTIIHEGSPRPNPTPPVSSDQTAVGEKTKTCPDCALGSWLWILQTVYITVLILLFSAVQIYTRTCRNTGSADLDYENTRPSHPAAETLLC